MGNTEVQHIKSMKNEAIIVSTNYSDILNITLPINKKYFDRILVATVENDIDTQNVCKNNHIEYLFCDELLYKNGARFNRGAVYNNIFNNYLKYKDWITLLDSDIECMDDFKHTIESKCNNIEKFYGCQRWNIETYKDYQEIKEYPSLLNRYGYTLFRGAGFGFCQIFNYKSNIFQKLMPSPYLELPYNHTSDWVFRNNWGDMIYEPNFDLNGHNELKYNDRGSGLFEILPNKLIHLGITGVNNQERLTPYFIE